MKEKKQKKDTLIAIRIERKLFDTLEKIAERDEMTVSSLIRRAIKRDLRKTNEDGKL